jgi:hypothetical protein
MRRRMRSSSVVEPPADAGTEDEVLTDHGPDHGVDQFQRPQGLVPVRRPVHGHAVEPEEELPALGVSESGSVGEGDGCSLAGVRHAGDEQVVSGRVEYPVPGVLVADGERPTASPSSRGPAAVGSPEFGEQFGGRPGEPEAAQGAEEPPRRPLDGLNQRTVRRPMLRGRSFEMATRCVYRPT